MVEVVLLTMVLVVVLVDYFGDHQKLYQLQLTQLQLVMVVLGQIAKYMETQDKIAYSQEVVIL